MTNDPMTNAQLDWPSLFPPVSKSEWAAQAQRDLGDAKPLGSLAWRYANEISIDPYYTREDLQTGSATEKPIRWSKAASWSICEPIALTEPSSTINKEARSALRDGAESIAFEGSLTGFASPEALPFLLEGISDIRTHFLIHEDTPASRFAFARAFSDYAASSGAGAVSIPLLTEKPVDIDLNLLDWMMTHPIRSIVLNLTAPAAPWASVLEELGQLLLLVDLYATRLLAAGMKMDDVLRRLLVVLPVGSSFYVEIAKFRAARWLIGLLVRRLDPAHEETLSVPFMADTTAETFSTADPHSNLLRGTTRAMSAILGGCDTLIVRPYRSGDGTELDHARRMARHTQLIFKHEAHLDGVIEAGAGSYYIETITRRLVEEAWQRFLDTADHRGTID